MRTNLGQGFNYKSEAGRGRPRKHIKNVHIIIKTLHEERKKRKLSLEKLTFKIGCGKHVIGAWERGKWTPRLTNVVDWAESLGYNLVLEKKNEG